MPEYEVTLDRGAKVNVTQEEDPRDQSGKQNALDQLVRPQFPWIHHANILDILESKVDMLAVTQISHPYINLNIDNVIQ